MPEMSICAETVWAVSSTATKNEIRIALPGEVYSDSIRDPRQASVKAPRASVMLRAYEGRGCRPGRHPVRIADGTACAGAVAEASHSRNAEASRRTARP